MEKDETLGDVMSRALKGQTVQRPARPVFGHLLPEDPDNRKERKEMVLRTAMALANIRTYNEAEHADLNALDPATWVKTMGLDLTKG